MNMLGKQVVDLVLSPKWIIPIVPRGSILKNTSIVVNNGVIVDIADRQIVSEKYEAKTEYKLGYHVVLPGFVNAHTHTPMFLFKSYGDDNSLSDWLQHFIWPMEDMFISPRFIRDGLQMGCAEMIRSGTTCFNDMYYYPEESAEEVEKIGMRAIIGLMGRDNEGSLKTNESILSKGSRPSPLVTYSIAPHSPYLYDDASLVAIKQLCEKHGILMHIHVQETKDELESSIAGNHACPSCHKSSRLCSPIQNMASLGILDHTCCAHCVHVLDEDIELLAQHHASVVHCPHSNLKLGSGIAPVQKMLDKGVNVCLGTDGASSNNNLDMMGEMRTAALIGPIAAGDAKAVDAVTALEMATLNGAKALGLQDVIGSIEVGKQADLIAIDMNRLESLPIHNLFSNLVYATGKEQVTHVWVQGKCLMEERNLTTLKLEELCTKAKEWRDTLRASNPYADNGAVDPCSSPF